MTAERPARASLHPTMSAITPPEGVSGTLTVQLREIKLVTERLMMVLGVPPGSVPGARQFVVAGCANDPERTLEDLASLTRPEPRPAFRVPRFTGEGRTVTVDCDGTSLLLSGHLLVHHLAARAGRTGPVEARVTRAEHPSALRTAARVLQGYRIEARVVDGSTLHVPPPDGTPDVAAAWTRTEAALLRGVEIAASTWWQLYFTSNRALSVDTALSRYHTGDTLRRVTVDGERFIRQNDPLGRESHRREIFIDVS
ncbi:hypothetical protein ACU61A_33620 [Pseudonocardia sichuanensis]